jgi:hypothetical protein
MRLLLLPAPPERVIFVREPSQPRRRHGSSNRESHVEERPLSTVAFKRLRLLLPIFHTGGVDTAPLPSPARLRQATRHW